MNNFKEFYFTEDRDEKHFDYRKANSQGKETDDPEKIKKVIAALRDQRFKSAQTLATRFEQVLIEKQKILALEDAVKEDARDYLESLFNAEDAAYQRIIETGKICISLSKETTQTRFDKDKFFQMIEEQFPKLTKVFSTIREQCEKEVSVKSKVDAKILDDNEVKKESIGSFVGSIKDKVMSFVKGVFNFLKGYDKKLEEIKAQINSKSPILEPYNF
jgi:hypothetical protein